MTQRRQAREKSVAVRHPTRARAVAPHFYSDPAWEAAKSSRRSLGPHDAVFECDYLFDQYRRMSRNMPPVQIDLRQILSTLRTKKIPFVLTGAHGISTWTGRPRATHDVDILVKAGRNQARAVNALRALYPELEIRHFTGVMSFFVPGEIESVIDVTCPHRADNVVTLATAVWIESAGLRYRIPALEAALANKYGAMLSPQRDPGKRGQDTVDFYFMVAHSADPGRTPLDMEALAALGEKVWPGGGGEEILRFVGQARSGQVPIPVPPKQ